MRYILAVLLALMLIFSTNGLAQNYQFQSADKWVKHVEIPKESAISKYDINAGYYYTLADYQVNLDQEAIYSHEVIDVVAYSGISNASQLSVAYDTSYQKLVIHHLYIWRKGKKIDRTKDLSFEIMNNEEALEQGIYTGTITAYDILNDIRKDDQIDFAYTVYGDNPIFDNEKYLFVPLEMMNPIDLLSIRVLYDKEKDYNYKCIECDSMQYSAQDFGDYHEIEIVSENVEALDYEDYMPSWTLPNKYFTLSSMQNWSAVNKWAVEVFSLEKEPNLDEVFDEVMLGNETTEEKITKLIDYVQDDIRYMGIESGIGSIKPFSPEQVVKQRFGDCKDKSLLLVSLLKQIGVEKAFPALVDVNMQHEVGSLFPSNQAFNHCIVTYEFNDSTYWIDPSVPSQGGKFDKRYMLNYGKALVIGSSCDTLQKMITQKVRSAAFIAEELTVSSFTEPATYKIVSERYGSEADQRRLLLEYYSTKDLEDQVTNDLNLLFSEVRIKNKLEIEDELDSNIVTVTYLYEVDGFWEDNNNAPDEVPNGFRTFTYEPLVLYQYLTTSSCEDRKYDYGLNFPLNLHYRIVLNFPEDILIQDDVDVFDNDAFYYEEKVEQIDANSLQVDYLFRTKTNYIKAADYKAICQQKNEVAESLPILIYFYK